MKSIWFGVGVIALLSGCYGLYGPSNYDPCQYRGSPFVSMSKDTVKRGDNLTLTATVSNPPSGANCTTITKVVFYNNFNGDNVIGEDLTEPFNVVWTITAGEKGVPATGSADMPISAVAVYSDGKTSSSSASGPVGPNGGFLKLQP